MADPDPRDRGGSHDWEKVTVTDESGRKVALRRCKKCKTEEDA